MDDKKNIVEKLSWVSSIISKRLDLEFDYSIHETFYFLHVKDVTLRFELYSGFWQGEIFRNFTNFNVPNWLNEKFTNLIFLGSRYESTDILCDIKPKIIDFNIDLCGQIYWMLARVEEHYADQNRLDGLGRFLSSSSTFEDKSIYDRPIVDEWIEFLRISLTHVGITTRNPECRIELTHDLDRLSRYKYCSLFKLMTRILRDLFKVPKKSIFNALLNRIMLKNHISINDPYNTIDELLSLSNIGEKISQRFYILVGKSNHFTDVDYRLVDRGVITLINRIRSKGSIGLHNSFHGINNYELLKKELDAFKLVIGEYPLYSRAHYLSFSYSCLLENYSRIGIKIEDHSMCFADRYGFRCGTAYSYEAFDHLNNRRVNNLIIQPLIAMQWSAISQNYMSLGLKDSFLLLQTYFNYVKLYGGVFTYLIHNDEYYEMGSTYRKLLKEFLIKNGK